MKAAKAAGKLRDNGWIVDEVSVAFAGDALRWYIELDDETRNDWLRLQRAILQKYPPPLQRTLRDSLSSSTSQPSTVPIPSAAAAPNPASVSFNNAGEKYFSIHIAFQDAHENKCVGIDNGKIAPVAPLSDQRLAVRYDCTTKELRVIQM
ncbi:hypothetical protein FRC01_012709, partial [Tulasnella sp. 417]